MLLGTYTSTRTVDLSTWQSERRRKKMAESLLSLGQIFQRVKICIFLFLYIKLVMTFCYNFGGWSVRINRIICDCSGAWLRLREYWSVTECSGLRKAAKR